MIKFVLKTVSRFLNRVTASKELRPYERLVLDAWRQTLTSDMQQILDAQLQSADLLQRQAGDAKVCFYYPKNYIAPLFRNRSAEVHVATIILADSIDDKEHTTRVKLFLVNGQFFSIEFPKRPTRYMAQHHMDITKLRIKSIETHLDPGI